MNRLTLSSKLYVGFGVVLILAAGIGGLAAWNMSASANKSRVLSSEYIPEVQIATSILEGADKLNLAGRSFALSGNPKYRAEVDKYVTELEATFAEAEQLANANPDLKRFAETVAVAKKHEKEYVELFRQTTLAIDDRVAGNQAMDTAAGEMMASLQHLIKNQRTKMADEITAGLRESELQTRLVKCNNVGVLRNELNQMRLSAFKSLANDDIALMENADSYYRLASARIGEIERLMKAPDDLQDIASV
ncbi:MAG: MCP four helix bundle domain-containing protein, partial [Planctomycetota bacterium]